MTHRQTAKDLPIIGQITTAVSTIIIEHLHYQITYHMIIIAVIRRIGVAHLELDAHLNQIVPTLQS